MTTFLEAGLFGYFNSLFVFLFVLLMVYAVLVSTKLLGENQAINVIIAFILAAVFASSTLMSKTFAYAIPWLVMIMIIVLFLNLILKFMGAESVLFPNNASMNYIIIILVVATFMLSIGQVNKEQKQEQVKAGLIENETTVTSMPGKVGMVLRQPSVLGLIIVLLIASMAIALLSQSHK